MAFHENLPFLSRALYFLSLVFFGHSGSHIPDSPGTAGAVVSLSRRLSRATEDSRARTSIAANGSRIGYRDQRLHAGWRNECHESLSHAAGLIDGKMHFFLRFEER
jgi:hypothetical protein